MVAVVAFWTVYYGFRYKSLKERVEPSTWAYLIVTLLVIAYASARASPLTNTVAALAALGFCSDAYLSQFIAGHGTTAALAFTLADTILGNEDINTQIFLAIITAYYAITVSYKDLYCIIKS